MKKITGTVLFIFLSTAVFSQFLVPVAYRANSGAITQTENNFLKTNRLKAYQSNSTFSKPHAAFAVGRDKKADHIVLKNTLWGGLAGMALGASVSLAGGRNNRLKFHDAVIVSAVYAAGGLVVGLVTGLVKKAKQKKQNNNTW